MHHKTENICICKSDLYKDYKTLIKAEMCSSLQPQIKIFRISSSVPVNYVDLLSICYSAYSSVSCHYALLI
ncbi:hypothetical protein XENTR_v10018891 [Xenopus tropicalis]|nr:hypothetical protein XENTR_v10018891 [Xenopus tropicalis]